MLVLTIHLERRSFSKLKIVQRCHNVYHARPKHPDIIFNRKLMYEICLTNQRSAEYQTYSALTCP